MIFSNVFFGFPLLLFPKLKIMQSIRLTYVSCDLLWTCPNHLNRFCPFFTPHPMPCELLGVPSRLWSLKPHAMKGMMLSSDGTSLMG